MSQGIFGLIDFNSYIDNPEEIAFKMSTFLLNDGINKGEISYKWDRHYILGMKRTSNESHQNICILHNKELQALCMIHGEINNYQEILQEFFPENISCKGDLDLVIRLYRLYGVQFAKKLNGLFSLAILDERDNLFILLNDRFGMAHQIYWTTVNNKLYFATHLKTLLALPEIRKEINVESLNLFLKYSYIPSPWTIFKGINKLSPGNILIFREGNASMEIYWEFPFYDNHVFNINEAISVYKRLLKKSISRRIRTNGDIGILLSGGLDSSANVALATKCIDKKLKTFSVGFDEQFFDERYYARIVAKYFNTQHYEYVMTGNEIEDLPKLIWHLEEPYFELGLFLTYLGLAIAREEVGIVIGGEGADQAFGTGGFAGGLPVTLRYIFQKFHIERPLRKLIEVMKGDYFYERDNLAFKLRLLLKRAIDFNNWYFYGYDENEINYLYKDPNYAEVPKIFQNGIGRPYSFEVLFYETNINQDLRHYANENVMVKSGRIADMLDITLRESYLDNDVVDFLVSLDVRFKRGGYLFDHLRGKIRPKFLHRKAMEDLLPHEIMRKPKQGGFVPVMIFLKDPELRRKIYVYLLKSEIMKEYFRAEYMKDLFENYEKMQGRKIYWHNFYNSKANRILFLLTFDIWYRFYVNNNPLDVTPAKLSDYLSA